MRTMVIRAQGYDPNTLFAQAKDAPLNESLKILLVSISLLPMVQGAEKMQILSVCQRLVETEAQLVNLAIGKPDSEKIGEKDF